MKKQIIKQKQNKTQTNRVDVRLYNTRYVSGVALERHVKDLLQERNWHVTRSAGSHGAADLIAIRKGVVLVIQCKKDWRPLKDKEKHALLQICSNYNHLLPLHVYKTAHRQLMVVNLRDGKDMTNEVFYE